MKIDNYIKDFLSLIRNCSVDNTYKMALGKAIVELATENPPEELEVAINRDYFLKFWINCRN